MSQRLALLELEVANVARWLAAFSGSRPPRVGLGNSGESLWVHNFPLPDRYRPDHVSLAMVVRDFPVEPPKGLYLLSEGTDGAMLQALKARFNVFQDKAFHGAPAMEGFEWICVGYLNGWRYNVHAPHRGDNIHKMLCEFWRLLEET